MSTTMKQLGIDRLSIEDRLTLAQEIWDSTLSELENSSITDAQRQELERRLADSVTNPDDVVSWEQVKARALGRAKKDESSNRPAP